MKKFPKKRVVITGAGGGLGRAMAMDFAKRGWNILASDVKIESVKETIKLAEDAGGKGMAVSCDVSKWEQVKGLADKAVSSWGGADIIINNAGVPAVGLMEDVPLEDWKWVIEINLMGVIHGCRAFIPLFKKQGGGHIVNTASAAGFTSLPEMGPYNVSKAGVISLSETLRMELAYHNIGVTVACPTVFKTNLMDNLRFTEKKQADRNKALFRVSSTTAEDVSSHILRSIEKNRLYVITQRDAKMYWALKRHAPNLYSRISSFIFGRGLIDRYLGAK
jgi:NAD(P)-dependent dehydrogenase (short-subunit alcohol dehydrogenase family)